MARITIINQFYSPDLAPTAQLATGLAEHWAAEGHELRAVASRGGYVAGASEGHGHGEAVKVSRIWTPRLGKASALRRLLDYACFFAGACLRMLTLPRQDVILAMTTPPYISFAALLHRLLHPRTKLVLWVMDCYPEVIERSGHLQEKGLAARFLRLLNRFLFRRLAGVVVLDEAMGALLRERYAPKKAGLEIRVIPNWEPESRYPASQESATWEGVARLGLEGRFVVLYSGNAGIAHEFDTTIAAARELEDEPVTFLFVGAGRRHAQLAAAAQDLPGIVFTEYVPAQDLRALMAAADCALISLAETFLGVVSPSKLHANLACGLPVLYVGPAGGNVDRAVIEFGCGASLRNADADGMVTFIRELRGDASRRGELRQRARQAFEGAYSDRQAWLAFDRLLQELSAEPPGGA
ncbi:MAG: glycosyltransferase family 4 protein [Planctomycetota bacterium]|jgi:glycosyltransferase involved in cell wall biosynthesis